MKNHTKHCLELGGFKDTCLLQVKVGEKPYQALPRCMTYMLQEPVKKLKDDKNNKLYHCSDWSKQLNDATFHNSSQAK